ncbi:hypothetical protein KFK09_000843 [Dendrobium nobile]|uniref:Uncharacterized protein n=1 Tax=Dendrobium nobile TaxID=94219 RepID=A0A8T3CG34_DENNO|nr:hypothetical protein KFK09_000843 [Dendrobium nobile]
MGYAGHPVITENANSCIISVTELLVLFWLDSLAFSSFSLLCLNWEGTCYQPLKVVLAVHHWMATFQDVQKWRCKMFIHLCKVLVFFFWQKKFPLDKRSVIVEAQRNGHREDKYR